MPDAVILQLQHPHGRCIVFSLPQHDGDIASNKYEDSYLRYGAGGLMVLAASVGVHRAHVSANTPPGKRQSEVV